MLGLMFMLFFNLFLFVFYFNLVKLFIQNVYFFTSFYLLLFISGDYFWFNSSIMLGFGLDSYNYILLIFLFWLMGMSSLVLKGNPGLLFLLLLYILMLFVFLTFLTMNFMFFYFFFESSLIPIYLLVVMMGANFNRFVAGNYMLMYTLFFSLPMLVVLIYCYNKFNSLVFIYLIYENFSVDSLMYFMFMMAFLVKMPMFTIHIWLPKAHVEAPCVGSMILAGILLKLGSYGLLRGLTVMLASSMNFNIYLISYGLLGSLISSIICLRQIDLKVLIAYSSVVHMGLMIGGMMTLSSLGLIGGLIMMIGHGLCSSGLFYVVNVSYERVGSRMIYMNKGLMMIMPSMSLWWFLLCSSNMAAPVSLNLLSEIFLMSSVVFFDKLLIYLLVFISFFSACYSIYLFSSSQHGEVNNNLSGYFFDSGKVLEFLNLFFHWFPLNISILNFNLV